MSKNKIIQFFNVSKSFKKLSILEAVSIEIYAGDFVWIKGPSGAGKSTLLNLISGIEPATSGEIMVMNKNLAKFKKTDRLKFYRETIGYILQDFYLQDYLTIQENIELPGVFNNASKETRISRVNELATMFNISDILKRYPSEISGGQAERVCISRALFNHPKILLADEPTNNLDPDNVDRLLNLFREINQNLNITILLSSHDRIVSDYATRHFEVKDRKITEICS